MYIIYVSITFILIFIDITNAEQGWRKLGFPVKNQARRDGNSKGLYVILL